MQTTITTIKEVSPEELAAIVADKFAALKFDPAEFLKKTVGEVSKETAAHILGVSASTFAKLEREHGDRLPRIVRGKGTIRYDSAKVWHLREHLEKQAK